jgi:hypothetical protein
MKKCGKGNKELINKEIKKSAKPGSVLPNIITLPF